MDLQKIMEEARRLQEEMAQKLQGIEVEGSAGGGMVRVTMNGRREVLRVRIEPAAVDPGEVEVLEDLVRAAVSDAGRRVDAALATEMGSLGLPPGLLQG